MVRRLCEKPADYTDAWALESEWIEAGFEGVGEYLQQLDRTEKI